MEINRACAVTLSTCTTIEFRLQGYGYSAIS